MPTDQSSHVHSDLAKWKDENASRCQSFDLKARCPLWMISGMITFLLEMDEIFTSIVPHRESARCPSSLLWNDLGAKQVVSPRENNIPIDPLGASDVWRLPHHFLLHVVQHPEAKRICTVLGGLNNEQTPKCLNKAEHNAPKKWKRRYDICVKMPICDICVKKSLCSQGWHEMYFHLGLQHAIVNTANQFGSSFEVCLAQECKFQGWNGLSWRTELILCCPFCVWNLCFKEHLVERNRPLEWSHIERDWKPQTWC